MKLKLSKIALAIGCFTTTITPIQKPTFFDDEGIFHAPTSSLLDGLQWSIGQAHALSMLDSQEDDDPWEPNSNMPAFSVNPNRDDGWDIESYPEPDIPEPEPWTYPVTPDEAPPEYEGSESAGGGSDSGNASTNTDPHAPIMDLHAQQDLGTLIGNLLAKLKIEKAKLLTHLNPDQAAKLALVEDGLKKLMDRLNSGVQLSEHILADNYDAAIAEAAAYLAASFVASGIAITLSSATAPAVAAMLGTIAAYGAANLVEYFVNDAAIYTNLANFVGVSSSYLSEISPYNLPGTPIDPIEKRFEYWKCQYIHCTFLPPIILDLDNNGLEMTTVRDSKAFVDYDFDGYKEKVSWVASGDGVLFVDLDQSGTLNDYYEYAIASLAGSNKTDLDGLRTLDSNDDFILDKQDGMFSRVGIWLDRNKDAIADEGETYFLTDYGITSISLMSNNKTSVSGDSVALDSMSYTYTDNKTQRTGTAYNVMILSSENGQKVTTLPSGVKIVENELSADILDFRQKMEPVSFNLGKDKINGKNKYSIIYTGRFDDSLILSGNSPHKVSTGKGNDIVIGNKQRDTIKGRKGHDTLRGRGGHDRLFGGRGNDKLFGGAGNDKIKGGPGDDIIHGGRGKNKLFGGKGRDVFVVSNGKNWIQDYEVGVDKIKIKGASMDYIDRVLDSIIEYPQGIELRFSSNVKFYLKDLRKSDINRSDFIIIK